MSMRAIFTAAAVALLIGVSTLAGWWLGVARLAGWVPIAASTGAVAVLLGAALLLFAAQLRQAAPLGDEGASPRRSFAWIFVAVVLALVAGGYAYYVQEERELGDQYESELDTVSLLKTEAATAWRQQRLADARVILSSSKMNDWLGRRLASPANVIEADGLQRWLRESAFAADYDELFLIDAAGAARTAAPWSAAPDAAILGGAGSVARTGQLTLLDLYLDERDQRPHMAMLLPIFGPRRSSPVIGTLAMRIDPTVSFFPLIEGWPRPARTSEAVLVRLTSSGALALSNLKFSPASALKAYVAMPDSQSLYVIRAVPDSPWTLVTRVARAEFESDLWNRLWSVMVVVAAGLAIAGAILGRAWRRQRQAHDRQRSGLVEELRLQAARLAGLVERSPTVLYTLRRSGATLIPVEVSDNVERILGYPAATTMAADWWISHLHPDDRQQALAEMDRLATQDELTHEFRFVRDDGSILWISDHLHVAKRDGGVPIEITGAWHDVTDRRTAESKLRESEERLRLALESAAQGLWDLNLDTDEAVVSPEYATMLGYDPETFRETHTAWRDRLHPDDRSAATAVYLDYVAGLRPAYVTEFRQRTASGDWKWILSSGKIIARTADRRPLRMVGTHTDITARKIAELRSERLAELYEALSTCNFAIAHCTDQQDLFNRVCEAANSIRGVAAVWIGLEDRATHRVVRAAAHGDGPTAEHWAEISTEDIDIGRGPTGTAIREGRPCWALDIKNSAVAAPWRPLIEQHGWLAAGAFPLFCDGRAIGALTIYASTDDAFDEDSRRLLLEMSTSLSSSLDNLARDRRRAASEEALRESESRYRALFADTDVPRLVLAPDSGKIVDANVAAAEFYGWSLRQLIGKNISEINTLPPPLIAENLARARAGTQRSFEFQHRLATGELRDVQVFGTSITLNGETLLLSTIFDVTDTKRASAVLQTALHEREALLKEVHHRVKNNLQVISSLLRLEQDRHEDATVKSAMGEMQLRILSMALLHETLYRSSDLARVDLAAYLSDLAGQVFRSAAPSTGAIALHLNLASMLVDMDHAVPCGLLVNEILSNCLKHAFPGDKGGAISIDLHPIAGGPAYLLRISDTGVGLPDDFEMRQRGSLGVHLIRVLARQLKASLTIERHPGTTFSIAFAPSAQESEEASS